MKIQATVILLLGQLGLSSSQYCSEPWTSTGICVTQSDCSSYHGDWISGYCPNNGNSIRCCENIPCSADGSSGQCKTSCAGGTSYSGHCPGPSGFKCCVPFPDRK